jgi:c-di-GMP-binding flagellar brake protein YcgR
MSSLVPIKKAEIAVGKPLPWPIYDANHNLLMNEGVIVQNQRQLEALCEQGLYRETKWDLKPAKRPPKPLLRNSTPAAEEKAPSPPPRRDGEEMRLSDMKLRIGDRLQLQEVTGEKARHLTKLVGYLDGNSLIITTPARDGKPLIFLDRQPFIVRAFSGKHAFAFETQLLKSYPLPYPHLHLASPKRVNKLEIRTAERIDCNFITSVTLENDPDKAPSAALIVDLSVSGAKVTARKALGEKEAAIVLAFRCEGHGSDEYLTLRGIIRHISGDLDLQSGAPEIHHGVEFVELQASERLILENTIYRKLIETL